MKNEIYHPINAIDCECSVNSIDYDATDLVIVLDRFDNNQTVAIIRIVSLLNILEYAK